MCSRFLGGNGGRARGSGSFSTQRKEADDTRDWLRMKAITEAFVRLLAWRPHRGLGVTYWYLTGRKVRARNRLRAAVASAPFAYAVLLRQRHDEELADAGLHDLVDSWTNRPVFSILVLMTTGTDRGWLSACIGSVSAQAYDRWEMLVVGGGRSSTS